MATCESCYHTIGDRAGWIKECCSCKRWRTRHESERRLMRQQELVQEALRQKPTETHSSNP